MTDSLVKFNLPAQFVIDQGLPTLGEIRYGYKEGWINADAVITIAQTITELQVSQRTILAKLANLQQLPADDYLVNDLLTPVGEGALSAPDKYWLFAALAWLYQNQSDYDDPIEMIEMIHADFGHPEEINRFIRYAPPPPGESPGLDNIYRAWLEFIDAQRSYYTGRWPWM